jgi:hypothetical protein
MSGVCELVGGQLQTDNSNLMLIMPVASLADTYHFA